MRRHWLYLGAAALHLALVTVVALRDLGRSFAQGGTLLRSANELVAGRAAATLNCSAGQCFPRNNVFREGVPLYLSLAGAGAGYNFFAPHVPASYRLVFELRYRDGHTEYSPPQTEATGSEVRLASLLDVIGRFDDVKIRQGLLRLLAQDVWARHPDLAAVRAIFGTVNFPPVEQYEQGRSEKYTVLCSLDFKAPAEMSR